MCVYICVSFLFHNLLLNITDVIRSFIGIKQSDLDLFPGFIWEKRKVHFVHSASLGWHLKYVTSSLANKAETSFPGWLPRWDRLALHGWYAQKLCPRWDAVIESKATGDHSRSLTSDVATRGIFTCAIAKCLQIKIACSFTWSLVEKKSAAKVGKWNLSAFLF